MARRDDQTKSLGRDRAGGDMGSGVKAGSIPATTNSSLRGRENLKKEELKTLLLLSSWRLDDYFICTLIGSGGIIAQTMCE